MLNVMNVLARVLPKAQAKSMCPTCGGIGQVATNQGFISIRRTCPKCSGSGVTIENPCRKCSGEGRVKISDSIKIDIPAGVDDEIGFVQEEEEMLEFGVDQTETSMSI